MWLWCRWRWRWRWWWWWWWRWWWRWWWWWWWWWRWWWRWWWWWWWWWRWWWWCRWRWWCWWWVNIVIVFALMFYFVFRHLDNNQLEELPSGLFDHHANLLELWVRLFSFYRNVILLTLCELRFFFAIWGRRGWVGSVPLHNSATIKAMAVILGV